MQGTQIPIQTIANNTVTVTFKDAALTLKVTPQITASNTVIMNITLENASPDYSRAVGPSAIPPIDTQRADHDRAGAATARRRSSAGIDVSQEQAPTRLDARGLSSIPLLGVAVQARRVQRREPRAADLHHAADREADRAGTAGENQGGNAIGARELR